jgi:hypothetical protein
MNRTVRTELIDQDFVYKGPYFACFALLAIWSQIHKRTTSLRFLCLILRVLRLEDVFWRVSLLSHLCLFEIISVQFFMSWFNYSLGGTLAQRRDHLGCHAEIRTGFYLAAERRANPLNYFIRHAPTELRHSPTELRYTPLSYAAPHWSTPHPLDSGVGESRGTFSLKNFLWDIYLYLPARTIPALTARRMRKNPST